MAKDRGNGVWETRTSWPEIEIVRTDVANPWRRRGEEGFVFDFEHTVEGLQIAL